MHIMKAQYALCQHGGMSAKPDHIPEFALTTQNAAGNMHQRLSPCSKQKMFPETQPSLLAGASQIFRSALL